MFGWLKNYTIVRKEVLTFKDSLIQNREADLIVAARTIEDKNQEIEKLKTMMPETDQEEAKVNGEYPNAEIYYEGRSLPFSKTKIKFPVNVLITPNDPRIISDLKKWGLYQTGEDPETLIPKIYRKIFIEYYKYEYDKNVWGEEEVWEFPAELFAKYDRGKISADCDSFSHLMKSYYLAAGVPDWRVRVVCGMTSLGGHSSIYCYSKKSSKWRHINSTFGSAIFDTLSEYPTHTDAREGKDKIGISTVWFSFNWARSWYNFDTAGTNKKLKKFSFK